MENINDEDALRIANSAKTNPIFYKDYKFSEGTVRNLGVEKGKHCKLRHVKVSKCEIIIPTILTAILLAVTIATTVIQGQGLKNSSPEAINEYVNEVGKDASPEEIIEFLEGTIIDAYSCSDERVRESLIGAASEIQDCLNKANATDDLDVKKYYLEKALYIARDSLGAKFKPEEENKESSMGHSF